MVAPVLVFGFAEHVACVGEGRHPFAADQFGIPADVVDMQMRAEHGVDAVRRKARFRHGFQERTFPVIPGRHRAALLVVAEAGIDHDPARGRLHHQRVDRHFEAAFLGGEIGNQPGQFPDFFIGGQGQDKPGAAHRLQLDDFRDFDLAHSPMHPAFPLSLRFLAAKMLVSAGPRNGSSRSPAR